MYLLFKLSNNYNLDPMEMQTTSCPLCQGTQLSSKHINPKGVNYWNCHNCGMIFMDRQFRPDPVAEKSHYLSHNNDVMDAGYQKFVAPIVEYVLEQIPVSHQGLDYGAGPGPVISHLLRQRGYSMALFDPFFWNDPSVLHQTYDFVVACEVVEHFYFPDNEFKKLRALLRDQGHLLIMTHLYTDDCNFADWYYQRDPTHVVFYRWQTMEWIRAHFGFAQLEQGVGRSIILKT
jgi:hypothetical protein